MKRLTIALSSFALIVSICAEPINDSDEIDSYESAFHHMLHESAEFYLICIYEVKRKPWGAEWEQLEIKATVIEPIKGDMKIGQKISYTRVLDGKYGDISGLDGTLQFIRFIKDDKNPKGKAFVDAQDPLSVFRYSTEFHSVAQKHRHAEPDAIQPASGYEDAVTRSEQSWREQADSSALGSDRATFIIAEDRAVGLAALHRDPTDPEVGELIQMWVAPERRGGTEASDLIDEIFQWASDHNFSRVKAEVEIRNSRALRFYKKCGFAESGSQTFRSNSSVLLTKDVGPPR